MAWLWGTGCMYCASGQVEHLHEYESYPSFGLLTWHQGRSSSILGPEIYFNTVLVDDGWA